MAASRLQVSQVGLFGKRLHRIFNTGQRLRFESSFNRPLAGKEKHATETWKKISLLIAIPTTLAIGYNAFFIANEEQGDVPKEDHFITKFMVEYMMDDPEENRKKKNEHMALIKQRSNEFLERKRKQQYPPEPMDFELILAQTPRATQLGVDGY